MGERNTDNNDENAEPLEAKLVVLVATQLARGRPRSEILAEVISEGLDSHRAAALVEAVESELTQLREKARRKAVTRQIIAVGVSGLAVFVVCWLASILLGLLPDLAGKFGEEFGGHAIGAGVSFVAKETGHASVALGGLIGWAAYFVSFLALMA